MYGQTNGIQSNVAVSSISPTAGANVTFSGNVYRYGRVVMIYGNFTTTSTVAAEENILTGIPQRMGSNAQAFFNGIDTAHNVWHLAMGNALICAKQSIPSGTTFRFLLTYISAS